MAEVVASTFITLNIARVASGSTCKSRRVTCLKLELLSCTHCRHNGAEDSAVKWGHGLHQANLQSGDETSTADVAGEHRVVS